MKINKYLLPVFLLSIPFVSFAQAATTPLKQTDSFFRQVMSILNDTLIPIVFILSLLFFFWGVAKYIKSEGEGKDEGKRVMIWGVVGLFVISSVWGLVRFLQNELGIIDNDSIQIPNITL